jgi:cell wall-associated NlpC family hydrolase
MVGGGILAYAAIKGYAPSAVIRNMIAGKDPRELSQVTAIDVPTASSGSGTTGTTNTGYSSSSIVDTAMQYVGVMYKWGGVSPTKGWDCSGFVNYVIGVKLRLPIPGTNNFKGTFHGPTAAMWYVWNGAVTIPRSQAQPGDLACWMTHIGIVTGPNRMVNAHSTGSPTEVTSIDHMVKGEPLRIRRLKQGGGTINV